MCKRILAVEDEKDILLIIEHHLQRGGYEVIRAETGEKAVELARTELPDLVLLDVMLPGIDGFEVCRSLKSGALTSKIPIVMLSARGEEADVVTGLELGADDYVTKPFSAKVLMARLNNVLRRKHELSKYEGERIVKRGLLSVDFKRRRTYLGEVELELSATEFDIIGFLIRQPGCVFTRSHIVKAVKGDDYPVTDRAIDVHVVAIRKKLGESAYLIETVRGVGYRFCES